MNNLKIWINYNIHLLIKPFSEIYFLILKKLVGTRWKPIKADYVYGKKDIDVNKYFSSGTCFVQTTPPSMRSETSYDDLSYIDTQKDL